MKKSVVMFIALLAVASLALVACGGAGTTAAPTEEEEATEEATAEPTEPAFTAPEGALVSAPVDTAPTLDGVADDAVWADAPAVTIHVSGGENSGESDVELRSVYTADTVYFVATWADPTESYLRSPWQMQEDGTWAQLRDPDDRGGDNNTYYEDKFALVWSIANSIPDFETSGCFTACHAGENSDVKPYGNFYTAAEGQLGDIWHWKSIRNVGQIDDQYLDWTQYSADTPEAGRHSDPRDSGGYTNNVSEDGTQPAFMLPTGSATDGTPGYILESEAVPFDPAGFEPGDMIPGIVVAPIVGDRGDISAAWVWADGAWTLEFSRALVTGSEFDVQFDDLTAVYYFAVAAFDNAQVRHAFQPGANPFVFMPAE